MTEHHAARIDTALLLLRIVVGAIMMAHGAQKVFVYGFAGVGGAFSQMGIPAPTVMGPFIGLLELIAPVGLILGLLTRLAALGLACDMLGAIAFVHFKNGFFLPTGFEYALTLLTVFLALVIAGAGDYSLDAVIARRKTAALGDSYDRR